ncbi:hypothetical protein PMAYCL1PPCAC_21287, partial [Pristionchus mayeri]
FVTARRSTHPNFRFLMEHLSRNGTVMDIYQKDERPCYSLFDRSYEYMNRQVNQLRAIGTSMSFTTRCLDDFKRRPYPLHVDSHF